jgi:hypothetical protein
MLVMLSYDSCCLFASHLVLTTDVCVRAVVPAAAAASSSSSRCAVLALMPSQICALQDAGRLQLQAENSMLSRGVTAAQMCNSKGELFKCCM